MVQIRTSDPAVYMAGSMGTGENADWRQGWRPDDVPDVSYDDDSYLGWQVKWAEMIDFTYVGPFGDAMSNHSFLHGHDAAMYCGEDAIFKRSMSGIDAAEIVIAMLDTNDLSSHGTIAEIGYAYAKGKPVHLIFLHGEPSDEAAQLYKEGRTADDDPIYSMEEAQIRADGGHVPWFVASMARRIHYTPRSGKAAAALKALIIALVDLETDAGKREAYINMTMDEIAEAFRASLAAAKGV